MDQASTNWEIIEGAARGLDEARELLANRYAAPIRTYIAARWRSDPLSHTVSDAMQQVFLELYRTGGVLERSERERGAAFRGLLYGVSRNVARRVEESKGRKSPRSFDGADEVPDEGTLRESFDRAWARRCVDAALVSMAEGSSEDQDHARLLRERFFEGRPIRELAVEWSVPLAALHRRYARARDRFRKALATVIAPDCPEANDAEIEEECRALIGFLSE